MALGNYNGQAKIFRSKFSPSSSILKMAELHKQIYPYTKDIWEEEIKIMTLDDFVALEKIILQPQILIKLDVQGFEDKVLKGATNTLKKAKVIITEISFHELYEGQPLFNDIYTVLTKMDFKYKGNIFTQYHPKKKTPLFADAFFASD